MDTDLCPRPPVLSIVFGTRSYDDALLLRLSWEPAATVGPSIWLCRLAVELPLDPWNVEEMFHSSAVSRRVLAGIDQLAVEVSLHAPAEEADRILSGGLFGRPQFTTEGEWTGYERPASPSQRPPT